jgi:cytochrome c556
MVRVRFAAVSLVVLAAAAWALNGSRAGEEKDPSIKEIMTKAHKDSNSLLAMIRKGLQSDEADWPDIQKETKELVKLGTALGKNEPPRGSKESWEKLTRAYLANAKALESDAQKKDQEAAKKDLGKLTGSCRSCHGAHKPR